ncbi:MAG: twin-arginine translocase subunit TatC [Bryobacteraceae bacterium]|nr:twin-arginine translocase subunit TatC [Bryobacteraceae bacterium]MDW8378609.1 twin-arginine translocase subunit TatC [Bryobacterales bacterium]
MAQEPDKQGASSETWEAKSVAAPASGAASDTGPRQDDSTSSYEDPYAYETNAVALTQEPSGPPPSTPPESSSSSPPPSPPPETKSEEEDEEEGMLRMSFLEHLEELRSRIIKALIGLALAFLLSLTFSNQLWNFVRAPAKDALVQLGIDPPKLVQNTPLESFSIIWVKLPLLTALFLGSPWVLYQVWAFIAPGLYKRERRWAAPFIIISAGLFVIGGLFAYFVAFRFGLVFLLGLGRDSDLQVLVSITEYFDLFVNVILGVALVFELPVIIFFLTLLHLASPRWLLENSRYAILGIVVLAAIITPTPDIFNLMIFSVPMVLLYFVGVFASYLLVLHRENQKFPWKLLFGIIAGFLVLGAGAVYVAVSRHGYRLVPQFPFLSR